MSVVKGRRGGHLGRGGASLAIALLAALAGQVPNAQGQTGGDLCLTMDAPEITRPAVPLRFGVTPQLAGNVGTGQGEALPLEGPQTRRALEALRPLNRQLLVHLNRLFWADRGQGLRRFERLAERYGRHGFPSEIQVRYHPDSSQEGDIPAWRQYVRRVVRRFARNPMVDGFTITNEVNFPASPNTSDGAFDGARRALVRGIVAADRERRRLGRTDLELGFSVMWRWLPHEDRAFWQEIGELATPRFRRALDYVGLQVYPHLVWPTVQLPGRSAGRDVVEPLALLRHCFMPQAGLGRGIELWVTENGYTTAPVLGSERQQEEKLRSTIDWLSRYSGELNAPEYRWFNLRDNNSNGLDLFDQVGLLRDDYTRKPAFRAYRQLIRRHGR